MATQRGSGGDKNANPDDATAADCPATGVSTLSDVVHRWHGASGASRLTKFATKNVSFIPPLLDGRLDAVWGSLVEFRRNGAVLAGTRPPGLPASPPPPSSSSCHHDGGPASGASPPPLGASVDGDGVAVPPGTFFIPLDAVVFCPGYAARFPFLPPALRPPGDGDFRQLFLHAFHPTLAHLGNNNDSCSSDGIVSGRVDVDDARERRRWPRAASLAFLGFARPTTGALPAANELLARYFARLVAADGDLPADAAARTARDGAAERAAFRHSPGCSTLMNPAHFNDTVAALVGCLLPPATLARLAVARPADFLRLHVCTDLACRYRLVGPGARPDLAWAWLRRARTADPIANCFSLALHKVAWCAGLAGPDPVVAMRAAGVDLTSRQNRFAALGACGAARPCGPELVAAAAALCAALASLWWLSALPLPA